VQRLRWRLRATHVELVGEPVIKAFVAEAMNEDMRLENAMRTVKNRRAIVVLHYAPVAETAEGEPLEIMPFLGCSRLGETIDRFKVSAVVHGHAHRGKYEGRTPAGQPVYNVAAQIEKPSGRVAAALLRARVGFPIVLD
jgi:Icc-related predicted phosphoesterase